MMPAVGFLNGVWAGFLRANSLLFVLRLLREGGMSESGLLEELRSRYGSAPSARDLRRLTELAVRGGYMSLDRAEAPQTLRITGAGVELLRRLEEEYRAVAMQLVSPKGTLLTR